MCASCTHPHSIDKNLVQIDRVFCSMYEPYLSGTPSSMRYLIVNSSNQAASQKGDSLMV